MLGEYDFHLLQVQYLKAAMLQIPTFAPLLMTTAQMQTEYDNGVTVRADYLNKRAALSLARGELHEKHEEAHQVAIGVYGVMKTRYRKDPGSLEAINSLPVKDQTVEQTRQRMGAMQALWTQLPNDPYSSPAGPFVAWVGMDQAAFDTKLTTMTTAHAAFVTADENFEMAEGNLHTKDAHLAELIVSALEEGRSQFPIGTPQREVIDSIPTTPAAQEPNQAEITAASSPAAGQVEFQYSAQRGTSYDVLHKGPGETDFTTVADDVIVTTYAASGLAPGTHEYKVIGQNSRGNGPASEVTSIAVA
ncbi:MAG: hypothetical protein FJ302_21595 [Planctomycetes bacterium]|nr:hypothetical protein [Planctomycetota bacterium]